MGVAASPGPGEGQVPGVGGAPALARMRPGFQHLPAVGPTGLIPTGPNAGPAAGAEPGQHPPRSARVIPVSLAEARDAEPQKGTQQDPGFWQSLPRSLPRGPTLSGAAGAGFKADPGTSDPSAKESGQNDKV